MMNQNPDHMNQPVYSVVIPVFNSSQSLTELWSGILGVFSGMNESFEVVFVDDNSDDDSWDILCKLKEQSPQNITAIRLSRNFGQHNATLCGLGFTKGELVITMDDDLQMPPDEIPALIGRYRETGADLVYGIFGTKSHSAIRNLGSASLKKSAKYLRNSPGEGSSFRFMTAGLVKKILHHRQNFIFLDEVLLWYTDAIAFVEVKHLPRKYKQSGYTFRKLLSLAGNIMLYYTTVPLKMLVFGGFILSLFSLGFGIHFIVKKLIYSVPLGYTSLIVTILFSTSIILFSLGIIGEYLRRIYQVQNQKPPFSIRKVL
jgi:polyisoprenyl-phosphate glycosyltransferase